MTSAPSFKLRLPCAVLRVWRLDENGGEITTPDSPRTELELPPGVFTAGDETYGVIPWAGDAAVYDSATDWARQLVHEARTSSDGSNARVLGLIYPGDAITDNQSIDLNETPLDRDISAQRPRFEPGIYLSGRAAKMLEYIPLLAPGGDYVGPSGKTLPFARFEQALYDQVPWRNPEVLGQLSKFVPRRELSRSLSKLLSEETVCRISGPMGCGKTRLVWEEISGASHSRLWLRARPSRIDSPTLGEQIIRQVLLPSERQASDPLHPALDTDVKRDQIREALEKRGARRSESEIRLLNDRARQILRHLAKASRRTLAIVVDDFHQISPSDFSLLASLVADPDLSELRFPIISRNGSPWPESLASVPLLEVPWLDNQEMKEFSAVLTTGLGLPPNVESRFLAATHGNPFALEEAIFALVHTKKLRRIYGSFFFGGDEETDFEPSGRFVRHVEGDISRLGDALPLRLLALAEHPVPPAELASAASILGRTIISGWESAFVEAGVLERLESAWGRAVTLAAPYIASALAPSLSHAEANETRRALGELLAAGGGSGESYWFSYRMLAGLPEALEPLLELFKTRYVEEIPQEELLQALTFELEQLRVGAPDPESELRLLWRLLPLARRLGMVSKYGSDLARAVELGKEDPKKLLGLASMKAELEQEEGKFQEAEATVQHALAAAGGIPANRKALLLLQLGRLFARQNRFDEAERLFSSLLEPLEEAGAGALSATCQFHLGNVALHRSDLDAAQVHHRAAYEKRQELDLKRAAGTSLSALGAVATAQGQYPQALNYYRDAQALLEQHGREWDISFSLLGLARAHSRLGNFTAATKPVRAALAIRRDRDDSVGEAIAHMAVARNFLELGQGEAALEEARKAHFQLTMSSSEDHLAECESLLGRIHLSQRKYREARKRLEESLNRYRTIGKPSDATFVLAYLIEVGLAEEDLDGVRKHAAELKNRLKQAPPADLGEILDLRIYKGLDWLSEQGAKVGNPESFLARAYASVMDKAEHLEHVDRQRFLFQIPTNREIVEAATQRALSQPSTPSPLPSDI